MKNALKLSFADWAGLLSGRIATIHGNAQRTTLVYLRGDRVFVMEAADGAKHVLAADVTDDIRLNAHWLGFNGVKNV
jgi:hypothetical protein